MSPVDANSELKQIILEPKTHVVWLCSRKEHKVLRISSRGQIQSSFFNLIGDIIVRCLFLGSIVALNYPLISSPESPASSFFPPGDPLHNGYFHPGGGPHPPSHHHHHPHPHHPHGLSRSLSRGPAGSYSPGRYQVRILR